MREVSCVGYSHCSLFLVIGDRLIGSIVIIVIAIIRLQLLLFRSEVIIPASPLAQPGGGTRPPLSLLEFPPLGHYLNALVTAFNCLRLCCFTALLPVLLKLLTHSLEKVSYAESYIPIGWNSDRFDMLFEVE